MSYLTLKVLRVNTVSVAFALENGVHNLTLGRSGERERGKKGEREDGRERKRKEEREEGRERES